jgi:hypothetical protein
MLTLRRCRELIGPSTLTDEEVLRLRDGLYELAGVIVDDFKRKRRSERRPAA